MSNSAGNKIAKNTLFMYFRMFLQMGISLYMTRVVLEILGVNDFGLYNVIGGIVAMLGFFRSTMSIATQRFMSYEIGRQNEIGTRNIFSCSVIGHGLLCLIVLIAAESIGYWFVKNKLVIPIGQLGVALFVYQTVIATFIINLITIPYNSAIIAFEKFSFFAYLSIGEAVLKLALIYLLYLIDSEKLKLYAILMMLASLIISAIYIIYCTMQFKACRLKLVTDKSLYKDLFSFSGWIFAGDLSYFGARQGVNILINLFFGTTLNAARAVAEQVNHAIASFSSNFMLTTRPTIIKKYSSNATNESILLTILTTKFSTYLLLVFAITIIFNIHTILHIWLKDIPTQTSIFIQLSIINLLITNIQAPLSFLIQADGNIKAYQIIVTFGFCIVILFTWFAYKIGLSVLTTYYISIIVSITQLPILVYIINRITKFPVGYYIKNAIIPIIYTTIMTVSCCYIFSLVTSNVNTAMNILNIVVSGGICMITVYFIGLNKEEKNKVSLLIKQRFLKKNKI